MHLLVPGEGSSSEKREGYPYQVTALGVRWSSSGDPDRETRYRFCEEVSNHVDGACDRGEVELVHVLFGLFVNETLDTAKLREKGVPCVTTIHNVPPQECARSWPGDRLLSGWKDRLRLKGVAVKNRGRLQRHEYEAWVVPSEISGRLLSELCRGARIEVIGHGFSGRLLKKIDLPESRAPGLGEQVRLLTVGGWVPHKRQHIIPDIAEELLKSGIDFVWDLVGTPGRVPRYQNAIIGEIERLGLSQRVRARGAVSFEDLVNSYEKAHLYVQPSTEEGFCMTALDAAAAGLPVIGSPAGALPFICRLSGGALVPSDPDDLAKAIEHFCVSRLWSSNARAMGSRIQKAFNWEAAGLSLSGLYQQLVNQSLVIKE